MSQKPISLITLSEVYYSLITLSRSTLFPHDLHSMEGVCIRQACTHTHDNSLRSYIKPFITVQPHPWPSLHS